MPSAPRHVTLIWHAKHCRWTMLFVGVQEGKSVSQVSFKSYGDNKCSVNNTKSIHLASNNVQFLTFASCKATLPFINVSLYASNMNQFKLITSGAWMGCCAPNGALKAAHGQGEAFGCDG